MMTPEARQAFLASLAGQRALYAEALGAKIDEAQRLWRPIAGGISTPGGVTRLERLLHGLAGSGADFGFDELSAGARALEEQLKRWVAADPGSDRGPRWQIASAIEQLRYLPCRA